MCKSQLDKIRCTGCLAKDYLTSHSCWRFKELYKADAIYTILNLYNIEYKKSEFERLRSWLDNRESIHHFDVSKFKNEQIALFLLVIKCYQIFFK